MTAIALTIAGSDSGGGAGIQADLKSFSALGTYGASVVTAVTAQNTRAVTRVEQVSADMVMAQIEALFEDLAIDAIKIGMLGCPAIIEVVTLSLARCDLPIVIDPVMIAKSGDPLLGADAIETLKDRLLPLASVLTPNLPEAARLLGTRPARDEAEMNEQGRQLLALGPRAVLMKGGHLDGPDCIDLLVEAKDVTRWQARRITTRNTHGTGCSLSAAIAALLAQGKPVCEAVDEAHAWLQGAIRAADRLEIGAGHGPVHHFHALWPVAAVPEPSIQEVDT